MEDNKKIDEKLIAQFFDDNKIEIADDGFSRRVMCRIQSSLLYERIWTALCVVAGIIFFIVADCMDTIKTLFYSLLGNMQGFAASFHFTPATPIFIYIIALILMSVTAYGVMTSERS
jgi:hypothetical protein